MKRFNITVNGKAYDVSVQELGAGVAMPVAAAPAAVAAAPAAAAPAPAAAAAPAAGGAVGAVKIESPMPGTILDLKVAVGESVAQNQVVAILEAMKMENEIVAPSAGTISGIHVTKGDSVNTGTLLISLN